MSAKVSQGSQSFFLFYFLNHIGYKFYFVNSGASLEIKSIIKTIYKTFAFCLLPFAFLLGSFYLALD
jgi:hypothetical protein